ncbi:bile acid:sodium symporter family protein [Fusobacterium necrophorum]|uniref:Bile acid:sodium symporter family protein n=1 Tax=Fusobacterium necrophorum TaxID=859 RepID=A0A4Q2L0C0_9FUSO|nr:bile acid:sodium symporter family protein [Fusobacterium necrophorum]RXZ70819.1 bile acid:sodium symporter family protein [Fusobacterium necrophorum]
MTIQNISKKLASNVSYIIIAFSILAFFHPTLFFWANSYSAALLGVAMFGMGLTISVEDFKILCKRPREITIGCIAQYTIMPALAYCLSKVFYLPPDIALGVILVGCCPGGTASNVITYIADGDVPLSVGMTMVSTLFAPIMTPFLVYILADKWVEVHFFAMLLSTVKIVLLPITLGIFINYLFPRQVEKSKNVLPLVSIIAIVLLISAIVALNSEKLLHSALLILVVVILHNLLGLLLGMIVSRFFRLSHKKETAVAIEVSMQNSGLAINLALTNFAANPIATIPGAIFSVWHNIAGSIFASLRRTRNDICTR